MAMRTTCSNSKTQGLAAARRTCDGAFLSERGTAETGGATPEHGAPDPFRRHRARDREDQETGIAMHQSTRCVSLCALHFLLHYY